jgi:isoleucyl-tRNA synthetase
MEGLAVAVAKAEGDKCVRCWFTSPTVGENAAHPQVCHRCRRALAEPGIKGS